MMSKFIGLIVLLTIFLSGCNVFISPQEIQRTLDVERQQVKLVSSSMGQRVFDVSRDKIIKALINAFSAKNLTVLTLQEGSGYMMAEGQQFLDNKTLLNLYNERNTQINASIKNNTARLPWSIPNASLRIAANLYEKGKGRTLVKIKISPTHKKCIYFHKGVSVDENAGANACTVFPNMASLWYQQLWDEIEKSIFMQRETILN
jgi:hypothetical protein